MVAYGILFRIMKINFQYFDFRLIMIGIILVFLVSFILIFVSKSETVEFIDVVILICLIFISNKIIKLIGEYIELRRERQKFELILKKIEEKLCQNIQ